MTIQSEYNYRGLPVNRNTYDRDNLKWCITGTINESHGIQEYCVSLRDAIELRDKMLFENCLYSMQITLDEPSPKCYLRTAYLGDTIVAYLPHSRQRITGTVVDYWERISESGNSQPLLVVRPSRVESYGFGCSIDRESLTISLDIGYVVSIVKRSKVSWHKLNHFRHFYHTENRAFGMLPFYVPHRYYSKDILSAFSKQYPQKASGKFNWKLFKRYVRQNWSKLLCKKAVMVADAKEQYEIEDYQ